jgi:hypothetical protein
VLVLSSYLALQVPLLVAPRHPVSVQESAPRLSAQERARTLQALALEPVALAPALKPLLLEAQGRLGCLLPA